mmetsp:Transcript_114657/g.335264  ORF Transcript_114657/g.335264 Transcript_114657/m.335264 type:complete len:311 (+) Transcript_114657:85-1017(+)
MTGVENLSPDELKRLKRDATIRAKEDDFERRRKLEAERKKKQLEQLKVDAAEIEKKKLQDRLDTLKKRAEVRAHRQAETEKLNKKREDKIAHRQQAWMERANSEIQQIIEEAKDEEERVEEALQSAREKKNALLVKADMEKRERKGKEYELEVQRGEGIASKANKREIREIHRVDQLKTEAMQELNSFIQNPAPVPLKQVLAGRVRPVPKVTELLAAYKDQREDLQDLQDQDIPMRALLRNQTVFQYVRDIQMKAEKERMIPPEPVIGDTGRGAGRSKKGPGSPSRGSPGKKPLSPSRSGANWKSGNRGR